MSWECAQFKQLNKQFRELLINNILTSLALFSRILILIYISEFFTENSKKQNLSKTILIKIRI